jgi:hypothetical protein
MNITGIACGRCLLQAIQKYDLEEPIVWGLENPQAEDESGIYISIFMSMYVSMCKLLYIYIYIYKRSTNSCYKSFFLHN